MTLTHAKQSAEYALDLIRPYCIRAEIAGSIRREKFEDIKDIEIVAIPITNNGESIVNLREIVNNRFGRPISGAFPSKYTKIRGALSIDFFWCNLNTWGMCYFIRTGSADFVRRALAYWKKKTDGGFSEECRLYMPSGQVMETPEEEDVFKVLGCKYVPPQKRQ